MKKVVFFVLIVVFAYFNANAASKLHVVQPGDTLWALSKTHYKDPFLWGKIWMNNTYLNDPNLIFPGEIIEYTKYGITIYKGTKALKNKKPKKENEYVRYDSVVFYNGKNYYSDCGEGFCVWRKKDFSIGKISYDNYNNVEVSTGDTIYIKANKKLPIINLYVYRKITDYYTFKNFMEIMVPVGVVKITKEIKPLIYKGIIVKASTEISPKDIISPVYPYKKINKNPKTILVGNVPVELVEMNDSNFTYHIGYYVFLKTKNHFVKNIVGRGVYIDRVNKNIPENTNIGKGVVVSQYNEYLSIFLSTNNNLKEMFDKTQNYVLR